MQPPLKPTRLALKSLKRPAKPVLWLKANTTTKINLAIKSLRRLSKLELTAFEVGRPLFQVTKTQVLRFTLTVRKLSLQGVRNNSCEPSELLTVDEDVELAVSK